MSDTRRSLTVEPSTAADTETIRPLPVTTPTYASLAREVGHLRDRTELTNSEAEGLHRETQRGALDERTALVAVRRPEELLDDLSNSWGLSWSTIAQLARVSDTAVRKWRRGE